MHDDVPNELRRRLSDPADLAIALGLTEGATRQTRGLHVRCPAHAEKTASCSITEADDGVRVHCFGCSLDGNVFHLIAAVRGLDVHRDFRRVLGEAAYLAGTTLSELEEQCSRAAPRPRRASTAIAVRPPPAPPPSPSPHQRPPRAELQALWNACAPVDLTQVAPDPLDLAVSSFLAYRGWSPHAIARLGVCRVTPLEYAWPWWWPGAWADRFRLVVLAYEANGQPASLHGRNVRACPGCDAYACRCTHRPKVDKTRWPASHRSDRTRRCDAKGLFFADAGGRALLRGQAPPELEAVVLVEGITDFLAMAASVLEARAPWAVLGGTSGSFGALSRIAWPERAVPVIATDHDTAGDRYEAEIRAALPRALAPRARRWQPPDLASIASKASA